MPDCDGLAQTSSSYWFAGIATTTKDKVIRALGWRPVLSVEMLIVFASLFFTVLSSSAFWREVSTLGVLTGMSGWRTAASLFIAMTGLNTVLLCALLNRWTAKPILTVLLLATSAVAYFMSEYTVYIDSAMVRNALQTDALESSELLTLGLVLAVLLNGALPSLLLWRVKIKEVRFSQAIKYRSGLVVVAVTGVTLSLILSFQDISSLMRNHKQVRYLIAPGNYLASLGRVILERSDAKGDPRRAVGKDARLVGHVKSTKPHLLVIVVGETVRAQNWGLNGYHRQTTPQLSQAGVINFQDVTACGSNTEVSVPCMFSSYGRRNYDLTLIKQSESLLHALERAGVKTLWRDNQTGCKGVCEGLAFESFREPRKDALCDEKFCRDEIMLRGLNEVARSTKGDLVVVLHQLGNHGPSYFRRYPESMRVFKPDCRTSDLGECTQEEIINAYDNAVLATDDFLARTIALLKSDKSRDSAMIYVSDHGESLGENNLYLHGIPQAIAPDTQLRVPMAVWISPGMNANQHLDASCLKKKALTSVSHDNLFHSVLGIMQVKTKEYDPALDLFGPCR